MTRQGLLDSGSSASRVATHAADLGARDRQLLWFALAVVAGVVLFYRLGTFRTLGSHEAFVAVPAREMLHSGDWIVPRYGSVPRLEKPPLGYWIVASAAAVLGDVNEWGARLPATVAAMALAVLMGSWARRWYGPQAAFATMLVQLTSVYAVLFGRKAEVDMVMWLCMTAAMFLVAHQPGDEVGVRRWLRWTGFYALLGLAWLAKFHYGPVMVLVPTIIFLLTDRPRKLLYLLNPPGLLLFAAAVVVWPVLVARQVPGAFETWRHETLGRAVGELGSKPWWFYGPHVLWLALPWTPFALAMAKRSWVTAWRARDPRERFLWIWFLSQLLVATLSVGKHKHYIVCVLPVFSLLAGRALAAACRRLIQSRQPPHRSSLRALAAACLAVSLAAGIVAGVVWPDVAVAVAAAAGMYLACGWLGIVLARRRAWRQVGAVVVCQWLGCYVIAVGWMLPACDPRDDSAGFARQIRDRAGQGTELITYRMDQHPALYYLGAPATRIESLAALTSRLADGRQRLVLTFEPFKNELLRAGCGRVLDTLPAESQGDFPKDGPLFLVEVALPADPPIVIAVNRESPQKLGFLKRASRNPVSMRLSADSARADE